MKYGFGGGGSSAQQPRVLIVSSKDVSGDTWQNAFLYHGLVSILGHRVSSWLGLVRSVLYHDFVYPHRFCCYCRGYSYARTPPTPLVYKRCQIGEVADALLRDQLREAARQRLLQSDPRHDAEATNAAALRGAMATT